MALKHVQKTYEDYGRTDPLYAVLSHKDAKGNRWDPEAFFALGRDEIDRAMDHLKSLGLVPAKGRALDFGCGAGRLTQALCQHFDEAVGVDISSSMIECADHYNQFGERCQYRVNTTDDLAQFESASFDFVYTHMSLQHSPPEATRNYIAEFFRILRPGGVTLFHVPSGPWYEPGSFAEWRYRVMRGNLRRLWKRLRGKPTVEMHYINQRVVEALVRDNGGRLIEARQEGSVRGSRVSMHYAAVRLDGTEPAPEN